MAASYQILNNVFSDVRYLSGKDSTTLTDANLLRLANKYYLLMVRELVDLNEDLYAEISSSDLVASQREYVLPTDNTSSTYGGGMIKMQRVEVNFSGGSDGWRVADPISLQQIPTTTVLDADINTEFNTSSPKYWFKDRSLWLAPVPSSADAVTAGNAGLYMYWIKRPNELTSTSDIPDIPKDFLSVLSEGMLTDVFRKYGRINDSDRAKSNWESGLANMREKEQAPDTETPLIFMAARKNYH